MAKDKKQWRDWDPDTKKQSEIANNIKELNKKFDDDAKARQKSGYSPNDLPFSPGGSSGGGGGGIGGGGSGI